MSRARGRKTCVAAATAAAAVFAAAMTPAPAHAGLTVNLQVPGGGTSMLIGGDQTNTSIPIQVWATVTGANPVTTTAGATTGNFDGLQYVYYNVLNSNSTGTEIAGGISSAALNAALGFNSNGSQDGGFNVSGGTRAFPNVANGLTVGSTTSVAGSNTSSGIAKPRSGGAVFNNANSSASNIVVNGNSVSFLVETLNFKPTAYAQRNKTTFSISIPTAAQLSNGLYADANWFEDTTNQQNASMNGQPTPLASNKSGSAVAGTQVVIQDTLLGDANVDGIVNFSDLSTVLQNFNVSTTLFSRGDFNTDGVVNFTDLSTVLQNFNVSLLPVTPTIAAANPALLRDPQAVSLLQSYGFVPVAAVPEPTTAGLIAVAGAGLIVRRRRR